MNRSLLSSLFFCLLSLQNVNAETLLVLGDSISSAYQLDKKDGWVELLTNKIKPHYTSWQVKNESISGETTSGALERLPKILETISPDIVIIELGGNDGLRGLSTGEMRRNLAEIIQQSIDMKAKVILCGIRLPPNYGPAFNKQFDKIFIELAEEFNLELIPELLTENELKQGLIQADGIHPNAEAQPIIAKRVYTTLLPLISEKTSK